MIPPDVSIVIVNWNAGELLAKCLRSIKKTTSCRYEILVADNNSTDDSLETLKKEHPDIQLFENHENLGFARANNLAFTHCQARYVLLLNPDTLILDEAVSELVRFLDNHPEVGAVGPKLLNEDGTTQASTAGSFPTLPVVINEFSGLGKLFPNSRFFRGLYLRQEMHEPLEVDWITGACFLVRSRVIAEVGGLNEDFFLYFEDQEWCRRIRQAGHSIVYLPKTKIIHYGNMSVTQLTPSDLDKNKISLNEYLRYYNGRLAANIAERLYFAGLWLRALLAILKYGIRGGDHNLQRFKILKNVTKIKRGR